MHFTLSDVCVCVCVSGEHLEAGIKNVLLLQSDEAIVVTAQEEFEDTLPDGKTTSGQLLRRMEILFCCTNYWFPTVLSLFGSFEYSLLSMASVFILCEG